MVECPHNSDPFAPFLSLLSVTLVLARSKASFEKRPISQENVRDHGYKTVDGRCLANIILPASHLIF